jgi:hypothetical protein
LESLATFVLAQISIGASDERPSGQQARFCWVKAVALSAPHVEPDSGADCGGGCFYRRHHLRRAGTAGLRRGAIAKGPVFRGVAPMTPLGPILGGGAGAAAALIGVSTRQTPPCSPRARPSSALRPIPSRIPKVVEPGSAAWAAILISNPIQTSPSTSLPAALRPRGSAVVPLRCIRILAGSSSARTRPFSTTTAGTCTWARRPAGSRPMATAAGAQPRRSLHPPGRRLPVLRRGDKRRFLRRRPVPHELV